MMITNLLTIDVEEWFHIHAFSRVISPKDWGIFETRVERTIYRILDLLDSAPLPLTPKARRRATFFILGWVAERHHALVKEIHTRGHEVACHGYSHACIFNQEYDEFRHDIKKAKTILEDITGKEVIGYRASTFSITPKTTWALNILREEGFLYDSSVFPIRHDYYGMPSAPRFPFIWHVAESGPQIREIDLENIPSFLCRSPEYSPCLIEFPMSTALVAGRRFPVGGGGYFRLYPYSLSKFLLRKIHKEGKPFIFYLHPWEIDPGIPKLGSAKILSRLRTYINLEKTEKMFQDLLSAFPFYSIADFIHEHKIINDRRIHHETSSPLLSCKGNRSGSI
ncbi:MAG: XrtA system polysaccharide deacetylase [bacterium]